MMSREHIRALQSAQRSTLDLIETLDRTLDQARDHTGAVRDSLSAFGAPQTPQDPQALHSPLPPLTSLDHASLSELMATLERPPEGLDLELIKYAGISAAVGAAVDLVLVGDMSAALGSSIMSALGAPDAHLSSAPKVSFDKTLGAEFGATGNHRWNSLSHHPTLIGLISGTRDVLNSTSTHIVDAEVISVDSTNAGVARAAARGPLNDPTAWAIEQILWAMGRTLSHWWSDVNTSLGLPGPLSTLVKCVEQGSFHYEGMELNLADFSYELYRDGLDFRRYVADGIVPLSIQLCFRWRVWREAINSGESKSSAFKRALKLDEPHQRAILIAYALCSGANLAKVFATGNPLLINVSQWIALARQATREMIRSGLSAVDAESRTRARLITHSSDLARQLKTLRAEDAALTSQLKISGGVS